MARTVLVVGAAGGVGGAVVRLMLEKGYTVIGTVRDAAQMDSVRAASPKIAEVIALDLAEADTVVPVLTAALGAEPIDLAGAVICAAICPNGPLETKPLDQLRQAFEINAVANVAVYQAVMPFLRRSKGRFILVSSNSGRVAMPFIGHYVASKHALEGLGDIMRQEAIGFGVDVVIVEPGGIKTAMVTNQMAALGRDKAALSNAERALYGEWYERFYKLLQIGGPFGVDPMVVAKTIGRALAAKKPKTRYVIGKDSEALLGARHQSSDRQMDAMFLKIFDDIDSFALTKE